MRAITICQPYATLIARGIKRVENRNWSAYQNLIGERITIHAGKSREWLRGDNYGIPAEELPFGAIVATAILAACINLHSGDTEAPAQLLDSIGWSLRGFLDHEHTEGPWCWVLNDVKPLSMPVPWGGAQGFWRLPDYVLKGTA